MSKQVDSVSVAVQGLSKNIRIFSLCLRSLYAVGSSAYNATGINKIRDQMRQDAVVFMKGICPLSTDMVRYVQVLFEYYEVLELDEWKKYLPDILKEVKGYQQCCNEIVRMHEEMLVPLKKMQDEAKLLLHGLHGVVKELKEKKAQLEKEAANSKAWAFGLIFVPIVGLIAIPHLVASAQKDRAQAVAKGKQLDINEGAIVVVSDILVPAISNFIDGLQHLAGFFNIMKEELTSLCKSNAHQQARLHHLIMRRKADEVKKICRSFYAMLPGVETDLQCIPENPGDLRYFEEWQNKQQEGFRRIYKHMLTTELETLLRGSKSIDDFQQLAITN